MASIDSMQAHSSHAGWCSWLTAEDWTSKGKFADGWMKRPIKCWLCPEG